MFTIIIIQLTSDWVLSREVTCWLYREKKAISKRRYENDSMAITCGLSSHSWDSFLQRLLKGVYKSTWYGTLNLNLVDVWPPTVGNIDGSNRTWGRSHFKTASSFSVLLEVGTWTQCWCRLFILRKIITWAFPLCKSKSQVIIRKRGVWEAVDVRS